MKWRLAVAVGLIVMAVSPCGWAAVKPEGEPRFGVEGERHRVVLPLSAVPARKVVVRTAGTAVTVTVPDLKTSKELRYLPDLLSVSAGGIRDVLVNAGTVSIRTMREVVEARAFFLRQPARLVVDTFLVVEPRAAQSGDTPQRQAGEARKRAPVVPSTPRAAKPAVRGVPHAAAQREDVTAGAAAGRGGVAREEKMAQKIAPVDAASDRVVKKTRRPLRPPPRRPMGPEPPRALAGAAPTETTVATVASGGELPRSAGASARVADEPPAQASEEVAAAATMPDPGGPNDYRLDYVGDRPFIWPELDAAYYTTADTAVGTERFLAPRVEALRALRTAPAGTAPVLQPAASVLGPLAPSSVGAERQDPGARDTAPSLLPAHAPAAAHYLAADLEYLRALAAGENTFGALALYRRAIRVAPRFPDRYRAELMAGITELGMGLSPEAESSFVRVARTATAPAVVGLGYLGAARARQASNHADQAVVHLRHSIDVAPRQSAGCLARGDLAVILAEAGRGPEAIGYFDEVREICPGYVIRAPRMLLKHAAVLATVGRLEEAEQLVLALPQFDGELFVRQKLLEGDLAVALGNPEFARRAYEAVRMADDVSSPVKTEAALRLARVEDAQGDHERAGALLSEIALRKSRPEEQARAVTTAADLLANRGRYAESFHLLETADRLGPAGFALGEDVRARAFRAWMDELTERDDDAGILAMFYRYRSDGVGTHLEPRDLVRVAEAARRLGLPELVGPLISMVQGRVRGETRARAATLLAEAALAQGEGAAALQATGEVARTARDIEQLAAAERIRGQALLQLGRIDEAAEALRAGGERDDLLALGAAYLRDEKDAAKAQAVIGSLLQADEKTPAREPATLEAWLGLADAAEAAGDRQLAVAALRSALERFPDEAVRGVHYRLARLEARESDPARAAEFYTTAAQQERDPLLARAAKADAAYYRAVLQHEGRP